MKGIIHYKYRDPFKWFRRFKRGYWTKLINTESRTGEWDWTNFDEPKIEKDFKIRLTRFDKENHFIENIHMSKESWEDLVQMIRRIT